jgi:phosphoadenosine phosphosulfate reductase
MDAKVAVDAQRLEDDARALITQQLASGDSAIVTSNFRPFAAVMLHLLTRICPQMPVVWMDSGYNTPETYRHAAQLCQRLSLNLHVYAPLRTRAAREALEGPPPQPDDSRFEDFVREIKLEPFERALAALRPALWFTGVRANDTAQRARMEPVAQDARGVVKVAPLLAWSSRDLHQYLQRYDLPNNWDYYDPTKPLASGECGLHLAG